MILVASFLALVVFLAIAAMASDYATTTDYAADYARAAVRNVRSLALTPSAYASAGDVQLTIWHGGRVWYRTVASEAYADVLADQFCDLGYSVVTRGV